MAKVTEDYLEARRQEILEAAARVFIRRGFEAATMQDIAAEADVSAGLIYRYFPGKDDLIVSVCCSCEGPYPSLDDAEILDEPDPLGALRRVGESLWGAIETDAGHMRSVLALQSIVAGAREAGEIPDALAKNYWGHRDTIALLIERAQARGDISTEIPARNLATFLVAVTLGMETLALVPDESGLDVSGTWEVLTGLLSLIETRADPLNEEQT
ncbi:MAG: TetR family transcriptional regulator [Dehalococcoidia bacterium]|nr:TetR family transcriptional regulator [Dehalococcoidia bacterium]